VKAGRKQIHLPTSTLKSSSFSTEYGHSGLLLRVQNFILEGAELTFVASRAFTPENKIFAIMVAK